MIILLHIQMSAFKIVSTTLDGFQPTFWQIKESWMSVSPPLKCQCQMCTWVFERQSGPYTACRDLQYCIGVLLAAHMMFARCSIVLCKPCCGRTQIQKNANKISTPILLPQVATKSTNFSRMSTQTGALHDLINPVYQGRTRTDSHPQKEANL